jgi:hypothetical protein
MFECKKKVRLAAVFPHSDQVIWLGSDSCNVPTLPTPAKQTQRAEAGGEKWSGALEKDCAIRRTEKKTLHRE